MHSENDVSYHAICPRCKDNVLAPDDRHSHISRRGGLTPICKDCAEEEAAIIEGRVRMNETEKRFLRKLKRAKRTKPIDRPEAVPMRIQRDVDNPYQVWQSPNGKYEWRVLKTYQLSRDEDKPGARWYCALTNPSIYPDYKYGDVYVKDIKAVARRLLL